MIRTMRSLLIVPGLAVITSMNASVAVAQRSSAEEIMEKFAAAVGDPAGAGGELTRTSKRYYKGSHLRFYGVDSLPYESFFQGTDRWTRLWPSSNITETIPFASVLKWKDLWQDAEFLGREEINGEETLAVAMTITHPEVRAVRYFSARTHVLVRTRAEVEEGLMEIDYSDYRPVDGMRVPFHVEYRIGSETHHIYETKEVAHNVQIDAKRFDKPGATEHD